MNFQVVIDALTRIVYDIVNFIPKLVNGLLILLVGYLVARLVRWIISVVLRRAGFDPLVERAGLTGALKGLGIKAPLSAILSQAVFVLLLLSFLITATRIMGLEPVARVFESLLAFLPTLIAALVVFLIGGVAAQFLGNTVTALASGTGLRAPARLGRIVQYLASVFVVIIALGVLGMDTALLVTAVTIMIGAFGLALSLALGLGARGVVRHIMAGYYVRQRFRPGQPIAFEEVSGSVSGVGGVNTLVETDNGSVLFPNGLLLEAIVRSPRPLGAPPEAPPEEPAA
jgi:small-conductance mechanosensitive channel